MDSGNPVWKTIAIWRAIGWTILLAFLIAAPIMAWIRGTNRKLVTGISIAVWGVILLAAMRSGGDLWDNPRYRLIFISLQVTLASWAWWDQRQNKSPWVSRATIILGIILVWFIPWYMQRYGMISWPITSVFGTVGIGVVSVILFFSIRYFKELHKKRTIH
jgi:hypothetical protein